MPLIFSTHYGVTKFSSEPEILVLDKYLATSYHVIARGKN